jgi:ABC-2 type transport system ATP-binding protein
VLDTLVDRGTTVVLTTQYLEEAERLADDIIVVNRGRIIARGDALTLKRQVGGDHVHVVVPDPGDLPRVVRIVAEATGAEPTVDMAARSVTAPTNRGVEAVVDVAEALKEASIIIHDLGVRQPTLDEVFLMLTGSEAETPGAGAGTDAKEVTS